MVLRSIEMCGFKSFAKKTLIKVDEGVTAIVGPNGCGKSNVVDAIRWVLGESSARALRGAEMKDVIFNGSSTKKAVGMAEVTLTLGECEEVLGSEFNEVAVTRRVFRDGKSEYLMNGRSSRLKDIQDLFADTGLGSSSYSIMEQGKIDLLLSAKPEDRRVVFEEAAGISKYKRERREAQRKLEYTKVNLLRVEDILSVQKSRVSALEKQVGNATLFHDRADALKVLDVELQYRSYASGCERLKENEKEQAEWVGLLDDVTAKDEKVQSSLQLSRKKLSDLEEQWMLLKQSQGEARQAESAAQQRHQLNLERVSELETRMEQLEVDEQFFTEKITALRVEIGECEALEKGRERKIQQLSQACDMATETLQKARESLEGYESSREQVNREKYQLEAELLTVKVSRESQSDRIEQCLLAKEKLTDELKNRELEIGESEDLLAGLQKQKDRLVKEGERLDLQRQELDEAQQELDQALRFEEGQRDGVAENLKDFSISLEVIQRLHSSEEKVNVESLTDRSEQGDIVGVLEDCYKVAESYRLAIQTALRDHACSVVVKERSVAEKLLTVLGKEQWNYTSFLSLDAQPDAMKERLTLPVTKGTAAWACDVIKSDKSLKPLMRQLLGVVVVVEDLTDAEVIVESELGLSAVTLTGELLTHDGRLSGGKVPKRISSEERETQLKHLSQEVAELSLRLKEAEVRCDELKHSHEKLQHEADVLTSDHQESRVELTACEVELEIRKEEAERLNVQLRKLEADLGEKNKALQQAEQGLDEMELSFQNLEVELAEVLRKLQELDTLGAGEYEQKVTEAEEKKNAAQMALDLEKRSSISQRSQSLRIRENEFSQQLEKSERGRKEARSAQSHWLEENQKLLLEIEKERRLFEKSKVDEENLEKRVGEQKSYLQEEEARITQLQKQASEILVKRSQAEVEAVKLDLRNSQALEYCNERYQVNLQVFEADTEKVSEVLTRCFEGEFDFDPSAESHWRALTERVQWLKKKLGEMGPVNGDAVAEFSHLEQRYSKLKCQHDDLVYAKGELEKVIATLNKESEMLFTSVFSQTAENFKTMFKQLFGEDGEAELALVDESEPLESGIKVEVRPPGKNKQSMRLLSGGERTMTAVALLFSIFKMKPAPFCVLDELDAPLDESNIGRFLRVLDPFLENTQFVIVTHHKHTMNAADVIYGVSMQEAGVSKALCVRVQEG